MIDMPEIKLGKLKFLRIRTDNEQDAMYALGALLAVRIESVIGKVGENIQVGRFERITLGE